MNFDDTIFGNPVIDPEAFISSKATVVGDMTIERHVIVAPGASLRADEGAPFYISKGTNIQDGVILHGLLNKYVQVSGVDYSVWIGSHCSIAHRALIHGPTLIRKKSFIGFAAVVHHSEIGHNCFIDIRATIKKAMIGSYCHIGAGAIVTNVSVADGKYVCDGCVVNDQRQAENLPNISEKMQEEDREFNKEVVELNKNLVELYTARRKSRLKAA